MKAIDGIIISCVVIALIIGAGFIYPGQGQELIAYKSSGISGIFKRVLVFAIPGAFILFGIRFFIFQLLVREEDIPSTWRLLFGSCIFALIPSILGSLYFFQYS
ncbi:MAG: hypothetical protein HKN00_08945 [Flavobacteriaceae bacterium]|nr:hypothetical protein [Bacteroidia bacterium]MBT8288357.1 hypothetical protein [Bacteroidia bacterium]NNF75296.1 hypothetical protein [Flavobacteriaceae bacterium]NNK72205.1 hypothetical protein [Flavobacteriaceae bacterium]